MKTFEELNLSNELLKALNAMNFSEMTKIQEEAIPVILTGSDVIGQSQTGTGKTYTMEGFTYNNKDPERGIIQRTIEDIFYFIESTSNENTKFIIPHFDE